MDDSEWASWGGRIQGGRPVSLDRVVEVKMRDNTFETNEARHFTWKWSSKSKQVSDVIKYRLVGKVTGTGDAEEPTGSFEIAWIGWIGGEGPPKGYKPHDDIEVTLRNGNTYIKKVITLEWEWMVPNRNSDIIKYRKPWYDKEPKGVFEIAWITWHGGNHSPPLPRDEIVEVERRNGDIIVEQVIQFIWGWPTDSVNPLDVMRYRVVYPVDKPKPEMVDQPGHYQTPSGLTAIDVIEAFELDFPVGNAVKYLLRCGKKDDPKQEIEKAIWYLKRKLELSDESPFTWKKV